MIYPAFYDTLEERSFNGPPARRYRNIDGKSHPALGVRAATEGFPTNYPWQKARELEGRAHTDLSEGVWGINYWRAEKYYGDPTTLHIAWDAAPSAYPPDIEELARRVRLHHYFRVWSSQECRDLVLDNHEVRLGIEVTEEWHDPPAGEVPDPASGTPVLGSHAVPLVQYDHTLDRFLFPNSWGERWGDEGWGSVSSGYVDAHMVEAWGRVGGGILPPIDARSGRVRLLWKSSVGGQQVHGREIIDAGSGVSLAWAFVVRRGAFLDIEELFVWPNFRRQGLARKLVELLKELEAGVGAPLRAWVPFADCEPTNRAALTRTLELLDLRLHASPHRAAGFLAQRTKPAAEPAEPRLPARPASARDRLSPEAGTRQYTVWYGTNRKPNDADDLTAGFSHARDDRVHYGKCQVAIPRSHQFGSIGSAWWRRWIRLTDDRLHIVSRTPQSPEAFWADLRGALGGSSEEDRQALVFLHGYRTPFDRAALRAAQLGFDLKVPGVTGFFSWPSRGSSSHYPGDGESIQASEAAITEFLLGFVRESGARLVHLIAHSMGNRGLLRAMHRIAAQVETVEPVRFGQIVLAAPDVDQDVFRDLATVYPRVSERTTLYVSPSDLAVGASRWLHSSSRVGLTPPVTVVEGIDTIEVPRLDLTCWNWHSYFAESEPLLHDLFDLIRRNPPPADRQRLHPVETATGSRYWRMM